MISLMISFSGKVRGAVILESGQTSSFAVFAEKSFWERRLAIDLRETEINESDPSVGPLSIFGLDWSGVVMKMAPDESGDYLEAREGAVAGVLSAGLLMKSTGCSLMS